MEKHRALQAERGKRGTLLTKYHTAKPREVVREEGAVISLVSHFSGTPTTPSASASTTAPASPFAPRLPGTATPRRWPSHSTG